MKKKSSPNPYNKAGLLSKATFFWMNNFVYKNKNKEFQQEDHFDLEDRYKVNLTYLESQKILDSSKNIWIFFFRVFPMKLVLVFVTILYVGIDFFQVYIMYILTKYLNSKEDSKEPLDKLYLAQIFGLVLLSQLLTNMISLITFYLLYNQLIIIKNNFIIHVLEKTLKITTKSSSDNFEGNIINLIQIDCQKFEQQGGFFFYIFYTLFSMITSFSLAFYMIGVSFFSYLACSVLIFVFSGFLYRFEIQLEKKLLALRDQRITLQTNIFKNIRFIKFNAYENFFVKYLYDFKNNEISILRKIYIFIAIIIFINWINPGISLSALFLTYFAIHKSMSLSYYMAFQRLVGLIESVFRLLPWVLNTVTKLYVAFQRLDKFLNIKNTDCSFIQQNKTISDNEVDSDISIEFKNANFVHDNEVMKDWVEMMKKTEEKKEDTKEEKKENTKEEKKENTKEEKDEKQENFKLKNLNFKIKKGELVFVIGKIGSGKSSLLGSMIGQMKAEENTEIVINGEFVFCPQVPYLMTKSIKDNIMFYQDYDKEKLDKSIEMSDLIEDINTFEDGVEKLVTEGGMNLSGGQRLRVNLARTFYQEKDIYLFDDPFSSLDIHVSCKIIENAILKGLKGKTRIVVSHSIQYLKYADRIMFFDDGNLLFFDDFEKFKKTEYFEILQNTISKEEDIESDQIVKTDDIEIVKLEKQKSLKIKEEKNVDEEKSEFIKKYFLEEEKYTGRKLMLMMNFLIKYYGGIFVFLFLIVLATLPLYFYYYGTLYLYDTIKNMEKEPEKKWSRLMYYSLLVILPNLSSFFRFFIILIYQTKMVRSMHHRMMIKATHGDLLNFFDKIPIGRLTNRFSNDLTSIEDNFIYSFNGTIISLVMIVVDLIIISVSISPLLVFFIFGYIAIALYFQNIFIKLNKDMFRLENITKTPIVHMTSEIIKGRNIIQIAGIKEKIINEMCEKINENNQNVLTKRALNSWFNFNLVFFNLIVIQFISFGMFLLVVKIEQDSKYILVCINYMFNIIWELNNFINSLSNLETEVVYLERLEAFKDIPPEKHYLNIEKNERFLYDKIDNKIEDFLPIKSEQKLLGRFNYEEINEFNFNKTFLDKGHIVFKNVYAKYPINDKYVLKNINFEVLPGEKIGICGKTGSGKSTIIKLISRYLDLAQGSILIDDYDIAKIDLKQLRSEILIISQEIALFNGTIKDNLNPINFCQKNKPEKKNKKNKKKRKLEDDFTRSNLEETLIFDEEKETSKNEKEIEENKEIVDCLINFGFSKEKLKDKGLDFIIENGGKNLSEGEQQLITIFRALFTDKQIIILDEATSSIDYDTEKKIIDYFYKKIKNKTVISIAHRINSILGSDKIIILKEGEIVESGTIGALLENNDSLFRKMYNKVNQNLK